MSDSYGTLEDWWDQRRKEPVVPRQPSVPSLYLCTTVNIPAYARAWEAENAPGIGMDDLLRCWRGVPTRIQMRDQRRKDRELADKRRDEWKAAQAMGMVL